jgi:hypothetical protein
MYIYIYTQTHTHIYIYIYVLTYITHTYQRTLETEHGVSEAASAQMPTVNGLENTRCHCLPVRTSEASPGDLHQVQYLVEVE